MISADHAIARFRRDLALGIFARALLLVTAVGGVVISGSRVPSGNMIGSALMIAVMIAWLALNRRAARRSRQVADASSLIAAGRFEEAEKEIELGLREFSLARTVKLVGLHHLALLRHAERRYGESAILCRTLLNQRLGTMGNIARPTRLIMADALLETADLTGAYAAITALYQEKLSLIEAVQLQSIQLDYLSQIGAWDAMISGWREKVDMTEIMPTEVSARSQACLALAAKKLGGTTLSTWLVSRVELLIDPARLVAQRGVLAELWPGQLPVSGNAPAEPA